MRLAAIVMALLGLFASACDDGDNVETPYGIGLYDLEERTFRSIPLDHPVSRPQWLDDGETFFAFDTDSRQWVVYDLNGSKQREVRTTTDGNGTNTTELYPALDGRRIVIERDDDPLVVLDVTTGEETPFVITAGGEETALPAFSPDGQLIAFASTQGDRTAIMLAQADGSNTREIRAEADPDREWRIGPASWSPDSKWLSVSVSVCPRGMDVECHMPTAYATHIIDLRGDLIWQRPESPDLEFPRWAGPSRIVLVKDEGDVPTTSPTFKFVTLPDLRETDAPAFFSYTTSVSPSGEFALDIFGPQDCVVRDATSGNEIVRGGCGLESWTRDGTKALIWDTSCSLQRRDNATCVAGRFLGFETPEIDQDEDAAQDVYIPGPVCSLTEPPESGLTPTLTTPIPSADTATPEYYDALHRYVEASFTVTFRACVHVDGELREVEATWYKQGTERSRFDIPEIVDGDKQFHLTYIVSAGEMLVCSERLGPYLKAQFGSFDDFGQEKFSQAVDELSRRESACMSDPHGALFFFAPYARFSGDVFSDSGLLNPMDESEDGSSDPRDRYGAWPTSGTKTIAGMHATCFERFNWSARAFCLSDEGVPLYSSDGSISEGSIVEAKSARADVSDEDFEPPYDVKDKIPRCFPREDADEEAIDVEEAIDQGEIEKALTTALLTLDDLDCNWSHPLEEDEDDSGESDCGSYCCLGPTRDELDLKEARQSFAIVRSYRDLDPYEENHLMQRIVFDRDDGAARYMDQVRTYWEACSENTFESERGDLITMRAKRIDADFGDDSVSYLLTFNHAAYGDYVLHYVRVGKLAMALSYYDGALGIRDPDRSRATWPADGLVGVAVAKMETLAAQLE